MKQTWKNIDITTISNPIQYKHTYGTPFQTKCNKAKLTTLNTSPYKYPNFPSPTSSTSIFLALPTNVIDMNPDLLVTLFSGRK